MGAGGLLRPAQGAAVQLEHPVEPTGPVVDQLLLASSQTDAAWHAARLRQRAAADLAFWGDFIRRINIRVD
jgi:hypothetical protein